MSLSPTIERDRWGLVAKKLIEYRNDLRFLGGSVSDNGIRDTDEQKDCYRRAAQALGPAIAEALHHQEQLTKQIEASYPKLPPREPITDEQFEAIGRECANDPTFTGHERQGRPATNIEMSAWLNYEADSCVSFVRAFMAWLDQVNEQTGLEAVASRLSVPCSISSEYSNV